MNIVDTLVVALDLDPSKFDTKQKQVYDRAKKEAIGAAKEQEKQNKKTSDSIGKLRNQAVGLFSVFITGRGIKDFVKDLVTSDAATARFARTLGTSVQTLYAWQSAGELTGGSAAGIAASMKNLVSQFQMFSLTGQSSVLPYFRALGVSISDAYGKMRPVDQILLDLSTRFKGMSAPQAAAFGAQMGLDQSTINLLLEGPEAVRKMLAEQKKNAPSADDVRKAQDFQKTYAELSKTARDVGRDLLMSFAPAIKDALGLLKQFANWAHNNGDTVKTIFLGIASGITALTTAITVGKIASLVGGIAEMFTTLSVALSTTPIGWIIDAIGLLALGGIELYRNWDDISKWWGHLWDKMEGDTDRNGKKIRDNINKFGSGNRSDITFKTASGKISSVSAESLRTGPVYASAQNDIAKLMKMGWSRTQATGIVANIQAESGGNAYAVGDKGAAYGLAQWHSDRQQLFRQQYGKDIHSASHDEQLAFLSWEMRSGRYKNAMDLLSNAKNAGDAAAAVSTFYERPAATEFEALKRRGIAQKIVSGNMSVPKAGVAHSSATTNNSSSSTQSVSIGNVNVNTKATDANGIARDMRGALANQDWALQAQGIQQ